MVGSKVRKPTLVLGALGALASAQPAHATEPISIWYRTADSCPGAQAFLDRLSAHAIAATLARAGDRIDFVVTLGRDERGSSGSLERQSAQGTVALRQVEAASCDAVADALALTLALSLDPNAPPTSSPDRAARTPAPAGAQNEAPNSASRAPVAAAPAKQTPAAAPDAIDSQTSPWHPGAGVHASIGTLAGAALFGGSAFFDLRFDRGPSPRARGSFVVGLAAPTDTLNLELLLGRLELCPLAAGSTLSFEPCVAIDLGSLRARNEAAGGHTESAFWSAAWALARGAYVVSPRFALELEGGVSVPLTPYEIEGGEPRTVLADTGAVTFGLAAGVRVAWP
jgi:hypothetical protein